MEICKLFAEKLVLESMLEVMYRQDNHEKDTKGKHLKMNSSPIAENPVDWLRLPMEMWLKIFGYLSQAELLFIVQDVCTAFKIWSKYFSFWKSIDFLKLHLDLKDLCKENLTFRPNSVVTSLDFCKMLDAFSETLTGVIMSRFENDCGLDDATLSSLCSCTYITKLDIGFCYQADMITKIASSCTRLEDLSTEGCSKLTDDDFADIRLLRNLRRLCVSHCPLLTNQFLSYLHESPNLRDFLSDGVMHFTDIALIEFMRMQPELEVLILDGEDITDSVVCYAASNLRHLTVFEMSFSECLTGKSMTSFKENILIERLKFRKCCKISSRSACDLFNAGAIRNLRSFSVTECEGINDDVLTCLSKCCPNLESLMLDWCWAVTDKGLSTVIDSCKKLNKISIVGLYGIIGKEWLTRLDERLPNLQYLDASDCNSLPDDELVDLVQRKRSLEVYTYFHELVIVATSEASGLGDALDNESEDEEWICPGERGVKVAF